ncbi:DUF2218 domain-containing protein [Pseudofrankia asymbiotica]|uniref:DUF2218 domain-containing protein n=1 Tax=Pseudofrankia asymbiotica TaxID=1834516 RepID=A0A1V2HZ18_9ACTN|nr:DUF2218 domain-containing protein [Pseudofrankia asymbiotica]ONH21788.1 hypothetical protein BL253_37860 [Pseudofrankia asymbiotica]
MPTAHARVATDRAARYLTQLCGHLDAIHDRHRTGHGGPDTPTVQAVTRTGNAGLLEFDRGTCRIEATPDTVVLSAEAPDAESLRQIQNAVTHRLEIIGGREGLAVTW